MTSQTLVFYCVMAVLFTGSMAQNIPITDNVYGGLDTSNDGGTLATLGAKANVFKNDAGERLDAHAQVSKNFHPNLPPTYGLGVDYNAPKAGASVDVSRAQNMGTHVNTMGHANLWESRDRRTKLDATANFAQQFQPRGRPDFGAGVRFIHNF